MTENKRNGIEALLRAYSVTSDKENDWLSHAIGVMKTEEHHITPEKLGRFLNRFSDEKPFGDVLSEKFSIQKTKKETIIQNLGILKDILEKVITNAVLPNVIPLRKMISLLDALHISLPLAIESFRVSLNRFKPEEPLTAGLSITMRRQHSASTFSKRINEGLIEQAALRRDLETYIKRLLEEDK